jgi:hypothetical protein
MLIFYIIFDLGWGGWGGQAGGGYGAGGYGAGYAGGYGDLTLKTTIF